jgi:hypothetical protein
MNAEMDMILQSVNSMTRTNRSSIDKSPGRHTSIDSKQNRKKLENSLRNSRKWYYKKDKKELEKKESEKSLTLDMSLDVEYTMVKCKMCFMYFVQKDLAAHAKDCQ